MNSNFPSLAFIGGGNMARSLIAGLIARGWPSASIHVSEPGKELREALAHDFGVAAHADNVHAASAAALWIFAVKPQVLKAVCQALAKTAQSTRPLIVSMAAGITCAQLELWLGGELAVVRAMPNTPALLGAGATGLFANARTSSRQRDLAENLLHAVGSTAWIDDEALMDAVTALSGSGPAYVFLLAEAMQTAGRAHGLPDEVARKLALQTIFGAARMLLESGEPADVLRQRVTSPGGTTQAAIESLESGGFRTLINAAIATATQRGAELSASNE